MADIISAAIASSLEITSDSKSTPVPFIGDFLISFSSSERTFPGRDLTSKWQRDLGEADWQIWKQAPSQTWKGYPLTHFRSDPWKLWLLGEFYGLTAGNVSPNQRLTEFIQHGFSGKDLNGHFLLFGWNGDTKEWHVWTDRFGTLHAYYTIGNHESAIGTFFPSVASLASPRRLNWSGLTGFFSFGFFPQDHTHFEGVRIFRPASHYLFDQKGILLSRKPYWEWWYEPDNRRSLRDSTAQFHTVINEIMNEQTGSGRVAIPISGGLDSRTTVAAFGRVAERTDQNRIWSYSYGYSDDSVETKIARKVASARGLDFQSFTIGPYLFDQMGVVLRAVEGVQDLTQCRQAAVREELSRHSEYVIAAHWGDVWLDDMGVGTKLPRMNSHQVLEFVMRKFTKKGSNWLLDHLCVPNLKQTKPEVMLLEMMKEEMNELTQVEDHDFRIKAFKTNQWSFRWTTASLRAFQLANFPRLPFYDTRMTDFFHTVPLQHVIGRKLQIEYLKHYASDLARIPWQVYDTNLYRYHLYNSLLLPKRALKKGWRSLARKKDIQRNWEVQFLSETGKMNLEHSLLRSRLRIHEFVAPAKIRDLLDAFQRSPFEQGYGYTVSMLLTFAVWLEMYG